CQREVRVARGRRGAPGIGVTRHGRQGAAHSLTGTRKADRTEQPSEFGAGVPSVRACKGELGPRDAGSPRAQRRRQRLARLMADTTARSEALTIDGSMPTPQ